jgi:tartrate dehydratase alpha subunit/fumarate hydratase class I-like protein
MQFSVSIPAAPDYGSPLRSRTLRITSGGQVAEKDATADVVTFEAEPGQKVQLELLNSCGGSQGETREQATFTFIAGNPPQPVVRSNHPQHGSKPVPPSALAVQVVRSMSRMTTEPKGKKLPD